MNYLTFQADQLRTVGRLALAMTMTAVLAGCATVTTAVEHRNLKASSKMSSSLFIDPVAPSQQTVLVQVRNTTDKPDFQIAQPLIASIQAKGWRLVDDPDAANLILQVNILQAGQTEANAVQSALASGYGGGLLGSAALGGTAAALGGANGYGIGGSALAVGAADYVGSLLVKSVMFSAITDVRVLVRGKPGQTYTVTHSASNDGSSASGGATQAGQLAALAAALRGAPGPGTVESSVQNQSTTQSYTETSDRKTLQTRIVSTAEQVNLKWEEALPALRDGLVASIGGLF